MATAIERATTIIDALVNGTATGQQKQRILAAFAPTSDATAAEVSREVVDRIRHLIISRVRQYEAALATSSVDSAFTEAP